ncbi:hypothetical protein ACFYXM_13585 [Streptomyces sp. NPDC002476]|uniref:hypothetical protein n=1 Tax=Streptomyces sp. NPDC002476 TaxID=3364648 RepID=UPI00367C17EC
MRRPRETSLTQVRAPQVRGPSHPDLSETGHAAPEDIAPAVAFLADPARSGFVNGVALLVDGGWTADASWNSPRLRRR